MSRVKDYRIEGLEDSERTGGARSTGLSRRSFLGLVGGVGASFALGSFATAACASSGTTKAEGSQGKGDPFSPNAFIRIDPDGTCTVTASKSDMGQGIRTTLAMLVAEELDADWSKVRVTQAPGDSKTYGGEGTGGSSSTRTMHQKMRLMGATARAMLVSAAATQWKVDPSTCKTDAGKVIGPAGQTLGYGELTTLAKSVPVPAVQAGDLKKSGFKIIGKATNRLDNHDVVTGKAMFANDVHVNGMVYAVCLRAPAFGASVGKVDDTAARKIPGVIDVIPMGDKIAVIGKNTWAALKGREALNASWNNPNEAVNTAALKDAMAKAVVDHLEMPAGAKVIEAAYDLPYLAHAPMEPLNAVADIRADSAEAWVCSQGPDGVQGGIVRATGLPGEKVVVHNMLLGGGFGRKSAGDFSAEAVDLSKRFGKPVKLLWSRECDMQHDLYRPMSHHAMKGAVDAQGNPVAWSHQLVQAPPWGNGGYGNARVNIEIPGAGMKQGGVDSPVPTGAWRSVENTQINVVNEMFVDELAHAAGKDPFEFRRDHMRDERLKTVLVAAAEKAGWGKPLPAGSGRGIACFNNYGSRIAHVVEVTVKGNQVKIDRCVAVVDVGIAVNPRGVEAQVQGAFMDGVSTALKAGITIDKGGAVQGNWDTYPWARIADAPTKMEVYVMDSGGTFNGMGEVGYPSSVPAIANAIAAATGKRARKFPIKVEELA